MSPRAWHWLLGILLVLVVATACSGQQSKRPDVDFTPLTLSEAPAELAEHYAAMKMIPGLFVLQKEGETYLLLMAGPASQPETAIEVLEIRRTGEEWRVLAVMQSGKGDDATYPFTVVKLKAPLDTGFKARLTLPDGNAMELKGMPITDR